MLQKKGAGVSRQPRREKEELILRTYSVTVTFVIVMASAGTSA